jgi:phosphoglycerate dehydrogenase-like enzyme
MKLLLSTGSMNFSKEQINKISQIDDVELLIHKDERLPLTVDIDSIEYLVTFSLLKRYNIDDFKSLKCIQSLAAGLNLIPYEKIKKRNIKLFIAKDIYSIPIAEFVMLRTLQIYKNARFFEYNQLQKRWKKTREIYEINGKTVGIIGFGSIGQETAKRFSAFGAKIISFSRSDKKSPFLDKHYHMSKLKDKLSLCDIVVICLPHNNDTHELFDKDMFDAMKDNSIFINVARGKIVNENDLIEKIKDGKFLGVGLDVTHEEPLDKNNKLWDFDNVYISPHNSYSSDKIEKRLFEYVYNNLYDFAINKKTKDEN